jgi:hypothetical protein
MPKPLQFDMVFLDHLKPLYTVDLKVMEEEGLIGPVSTFNLPFLLPTSIRNPLLSFTLRLLVISLFMSIHILC